jgi:hypothetical protein
MRAINHALTGAFIGLTVTEPIVALPVAFVSHYILDVFPHHGDGSAAPDKSRLSLTAFKATLIIDALLCLILVIILAATRPLDWILAAVCAFIAAAPDFASFNRFKSAVNGKKWKAGPYVRFANSIQWFERPIGAAVEVAWFVAALILIVPFIR